MKLKRKNEKENDYCFEFIINFNAIFKNQNKLAFLKSILQLQTRDYCSMNPFIRVSFVCNSYCGDIIGNMLCYVLKKKKEMKFSRKKEFIL